jgi:uncharacterized membrane protein
MARSGTGTPDGEFWSTVDRPRRRRPAPTGSSTLAETRALWASAAGRVLIATVATIAVLAVAGLVLLWPGSTPGTSRDALGATSTATVLRVIDGPCPGGGSCRRLVADVGGARSATITVGPLATAPALSPGQRVRVDRVELPRPADGTTESRSSAPVYGFVDVERGRPLLLMLLGLGLLAAVLLRSRGVLAFAGLGLSVLVAVVFVVPAVLAGEPALLVALVAAVLVMFVTLVLTHGVGAQTLAAAVGITSTLLLACGLALATAGAAHLGGVSDDASLLLAEQHRSLSLQGVVVAGMVIGALGVLVDTAVTQASAVMALRRARPSSSARELRAGATAVGRDHLSATIHTLVLAYVGASLTLLLAMRSTGLGLQDALNSQTVAEPVVAAVVGCAALLIAVPVTTTLAAALASRLAVASIPDGHGHAH